MTLRIITVGTLCVHRDRSTLAGAAAQPRRMALLALLARVGDRGVTREKLTALVRPDSVDVAVAIGRQSRSLSDRNEHVTGSVATQAGV